MFVGIKGIRVRKRVKFGVYQKRVESCHIYFQRDASRECMFAQDQVDLCRPVAVPGTHWPGYLGMHCIQSTSSTVCVSPNPRGDSAKQDMLMSRGLSVQSANGEAVCRMK